MAQVGSATPSPSRASKRVTWPHAARVVANSADPVERVLTLCARRALDLAARLDLYEVGASLDAAAWRELATRALDEGLAGLVLAHVSESGLFERMPGEAAETLLDAYRIAWIGNRRLRGVLAEVLAAFAARGVEATCVKGVALALRYYGEPALRPAGDLDLLVRRADVARCRAALEGLGCRAQPGMGSPRQFYPLFFRALVYTHPSGLVIELHWELITLPAYLPRLRADDALWARADQIEILGQRARYLAPADELRYLALHAIVQHADTRRAIWLVDIAELVRALPSSWDWDAFVAETRRLGLAGPVMAALLAARQYGPLPVPRGALDALIRGSATLREQRAWLRSFGRDVGAQVPGSVLRHLRAQDTLVDRVILFYWLVGRARRRWLRQARGIPHGTHQETRVTTSESLLAADPIHAAAIGEHTSGPPPPGRTARPDKGQNDGERPIEEQDTHPMPALLYSTGPFPAVRGGNSLSALGGSMEYLKGTNRWMRIVAPDPMAPGAEAARRRRAYHFAKRMLDVVVASLLLVVLSPVFLILTFLVKLDGGPAIYPRAAIGRGARPFHMLKFRTMRPDAEMLLLADPQLYTEYRQNFKIEDDPRVTPVGRWLRRVSLDELPQLWNVVRGEMSLVGPRAVAADEVATFGAFFAERQSVPPGLTGLWQVSGRASNSYDRRIELDREYVRTCKFWGDIGILLRTVPAVLRGSGAY